MADSSIVFGTPIDVISQGIRYSLYPITLEHLSQIKELITAERIKCIPSIESILGSLDVSHMSSDDVTDYATRLMLEHAKLHQDARNVSFDDIGKSFNDPSMLFRCFSWCLKDTANAFPGAAVASAIIMTALRNGTSGADCNIDRWLEISGIKSPPNPQSSGTAS